MPENFYDLLGVDEDATEDELKRAYRQRAREYHPDVNADARAGTQFKTVRRAYDVLRNETERSAYDRLGHETYVRERMKGLPTSSPSSPSSPADSGDSTTASGSQTSSTSQTSATSQTSSTATASSSTTNGRSTASGSTRSTSSARSTTSSSSTAANRSTADGTRTTRTAHSSQTTGRRYQPQKSTTSSDRRRRLRNRWVAVFVAVGVYVAGLAQFALASGAALESFLARLAADPAAALTTGWGLGSPTAVVQSLAVDPSLVLLFPLGALLLPAALVTTVVEFGRGTAWLYLFGALGPLVGLAVGALSPTVAGVDLALFVLLPVAAALVFLGDVGRYLVATR